MDNIPEPLVVVAEKILKTKNDKWFESYELGFVEQPPVAIPNQVTYYLGWMNKAKILSQSPPVPKLNGVGVRYALTQKPKVSLAGSLAMYVFVCTIQGFPSCCGLNIASGLYTSSMNDISEDDWWTILQFCMSKDTIPAIATISGNDKNVAYASIRKHGEKLKTHWNAVHGSKIETYMLYPEKVKAYINVDPTKASNPFNASEYFSL